jgi:hypothetical protein
LANHSCVAAHILQYVREKNTALHRNLSRSISMPVGMTLPVSGHLIITIPILISSSLASPHGDDGRHRLDGVSSGEDARPADPRGR